MVRMTQNGICSKGQLMLTLWHLTVQSYFDTLLCYVCSVTFFGAPAVLKDMDWKILVKHG